jgi:pilus assembly protein CpaC
MIRRRLLCFGLYLLSAVALAAEELPDELRLTVGDTQVLTLDVQRVAIGNGHLLSVSRPEPDQLLLLAEAAGSTTLELWLRDGQQRRVRVTVADINLNEQLQQVQGLLQGSSNIQARIAGRHIVLEGLRVSEADQSKAAQVVASFPGVVLDFIGRVGWEAMVRMDVRIVEVRRDKVSDLGLRWDSGLSGPRVGLQLGQGVANAGASWALATQISSRIDLLASQGLAETLAQPMLSCRSGGTARFVSGGEVPIPVVDGLGSTDVQYKEYGVILEVRPKADAGGGIYAEIEAELSQIDESVRVQNLPGFIKRRSSTAVNVRDGETIVIAGLLARERGVSKQAIPGLGRLPALGRLFSSQHKLMRQTELLVLITPHLLTADSLQQVP